MGKRIGICLMGFILFCTIFYPAIRQGIHYHPWIHWHIPTFLHVFILSIITFCFAGNNSPRWWGIPFFWTTANVLFECIQGLFNPHFGTFDPLDIGAGITAGTICTVMFRTLPVIRSTSEWGHYLTITIGCLILTATQFNVGDRDNEETNVEDIFNVPPSGGQCNSMITAT